MKIGFIKTVNRSCGWNSNIGMRVQKGALVGIECKAVNSRSKRQDQYSRCSSIVDVGKYVEEPSKHTNT